MDAPLRHFALPYWQPWRACPPKLCLMCQRLAEPDRLPPARLRHPLPPPLPTRSGHGSAQLEYKYVVRSERDKSAVRWKEGYNQHLQLPAAPARLHVSDTWDDSQREVEVRPRWRWWGGVDGDGGGAGGVPARLLVSLLLGASWLHDGMLVQQPMACWPCAKLAHQHRCCWQRAAALLEPTLTPYTGGPAPARLQVEMPGAAAAAAPPPPPPPPAAPAPAPAPAPAAAPAPAPAPAAAAQSAPPVRRGRPRKVDEQAAVLNTMTKQADRAMQQLDKAVGRSMDLLASSADPAAPELLAADRLLAAAAKRATTMHRALEAVKEAKILPDAGATSGGAKQRRRRSKDGGQAAQ